MNLQVLQGLYQNDIRLKQIAAGISMPNPKQRVYLDNLRGSSINFIGTTIWQLADVNHVFILNDKEEAAYFLNDLQRFEEGYFNTYFFPETSRVPYQTENTDNANIVLRAEVLKSLSEKWKRPRVVVTYPDALSENVVTKTQLKSHPLSPTLPYLTGRKKVRSR